MGINYGHFIKIINNSHNFHGIYWELMNYTQYLIQSTGNGNGSFQWIMLVDIVMEF